MRPRQRLHNFTPFGFEALGSCEPGANLIFKTLLKFLIDSTHDQIWRLSSATHHNNKAIQSGIAASLLVAIGRGFEDLRIAP